MLSKQYGPMIPNEKNQIQRRVLIVDDQNIFATGLKSLLLTIDGITVSSIIKSGNCVLSALKKFKPDVLLLDIDLPGKSGLELLPTIRKKHPSLIIAIMTMHMQRDLISKSRTGGANAFLNKDASSIELKSVLFSELDDQFYVSKCLLKYLKDSPKRPKQIRLTAREQEVVKCICKGMNNEEISGHLFISYETVKTHRKNIFRKLKLSKACELVTYAYENQIYIGGSSKPS